MNLTEEKKPEIIALLIQGKTINEVHRITGVSKSAIWRIKDKIIDPNETIYNKRSFLSDWISKWPG